MKKIKNARESGYTIICGGTTNAYVPQEIQGATDIPPQNRYYQGRQRHPCEWESCRYLIRIRRWDHSEGAEDNERKRFPLLKIIEKIKGEPFLPDFKGTCKMCRYKCIYAGKDQSDLPEWLRD